MTKLFPAEGVTNDPEVGGFVVEFPSGTRKSVAWRSQAPIQDTLEAAKQYVVKLVQAMLDEQSAVFRRDHAEAARCHAERRRLLFRAGELIERLKA